MTNRGSLIAGSILVLVGIVLLVQLFIPGSWPLIIIGIGAAFLIPAIVFRLGGLAIPGSIIATTGLILLYQAFTHDWISWFFVWPLIPGAVGLGLLLGSLFGGWRVRIRQVGWSWLLAGLLFFAIFRWLYLIYPIRYSWPFIVIGVGAMFLLVAILARLSGMVISATVIGTAGFILYYQNITSDWESWSYLWPLLPGSVGLGLVVGNIFGLGGRGVRWAGMWIIISSLIFLAIFAGFFGREIGITRYWPVLVILAGLLILAQNYSRRK